MSVFVVVFVYSVTTMPWEILFTVVKFFQLQNIIDQNVVASHYNVAMNLEFTYIGSSLAGIYVYKIISNVIWRIPPPISLGLFHNAG